MKKILSILLLVLFTASSALAYEVETSVTLNGDYIMGDAHHLLIGDRVFIVARTLCESLNLTISWQAESRQVQIQGQDSLILLTIDDPQVTYNDQVFTYDVAPFIKNDRTYIPIRLVSELLGCQVTWDSQTLTVHVTKEDLIINPSYVYQRPYTDDDLYWLAKIVQVESDYDSVPMKIGIANVVLNRVKDPRFPSSVYDVIFDDQYAVQFPPAHKASFTDVKADSLSLMASKRALEGYNNVGGSLYFNHRPFQSRADDLYTIIDGEYFYE